jgi:hypothetical protein
MTKEPKAFTEIDLAALAIRQPRSASFAAVGGGAGIASDAPASSLPQSSFAAARGRLGEGLTQPPPGEIDLAALSPSAPQSVAVSGKIDLEAIAISVPRSRYWRDPTKVQATRQRNIAARQKQALELWKAKRRASWEPLRGGPVRWYSRTLGDRILCVMEPGEEGYALRDLTELLGVHRNSVKPWLYGAGGQRLVGLVEKCRNRAFRGRLDPWALIGGVKCESKFLWRLTKAGERARELALMLE